ncbi:MAG: ABC transporter substrate-binding protein [Clostridia bacterium]|nr:ABC transporter substrate-binding protein [Clostridia bacterium]
MKRVLFIILILSLCVGLAACSNQSQAGTQTAEHTFTNSMPLDYAKEFTVDFYTDGTALITIHGENLFLLVPEGVSVSDEVKGDAVILQQPLTNIYQASSAMVDPFIQIDAFDRIRMTSTTAANWALPEVLAALEDGSLLYVGKYSAPDFEMVLSEGCNFVMENTMIYHSPEIKEKLEQLGLPVMVEYSSYEPHPLGRLEWIKLCGLLVGKYEDALSFFDRQLAIAGDLQEASTDKTVAYFHISTVGSAVVRKPGDYVSKMIELAGGKYVFDHIDGQDDNALSTMNMQMESFYAGAKDADILIYNSTIVEGMDTIEELLATSGLLADFKAVQSGDVWCTEHDLFQRSSAIAGMIKDFNAVITGTAESDRLTFLHKLH